MSTDLALHRALDAAHHLTDPEPPWDDVLAASQQLIGADSATLLVIDNTSNVLAVHQSNVDPAAVREYLAHYHRYDIVIPASIHAPEGSWLDTQELFSAPTLSKNAYYADFMDPHRMRQMLSFFVEQGTGRRAALTFQRSVLTNGARRQLERPRIRCFTDALQQTLARRRDAATQWFSAAGAAFDALDEATGLTTGAGVALHLSPRAEALLGHGSALRVRQGKLWHPHAKVREALFLALAKASLGSGPVVRLAVPGDRAAPSCNLELVRADARLRLSNESMVFIRIRPNRTPGDVSVEALCLAFDITPAEARVLAALMDGQSPAQHAQSHGTSIHTVRKQIAVLMHKMGCVRQIDLVRQGMAAL